VVPPDFAIVQLMVGAVSDHLGQTGLWRRYLTIIIDGLRAQPGEASPLPDVPGPDDELQEALTDSSARSAREAARGGEDRPAAAESRRRAPRRAADP
jgi:hypothetical protein